MKKSRYFLLVIALVIGGSLFAQSQRELAQLMRNRGEYYFTLAVADRSEAQTINSLCSVDGFDGSNVVCYANQRQYDNLLQAGYQPNLQTPPSMLEEAVMWEGGDRATYEWDSYLTYEQYVSMMEGFPTSVTNGANCTLVDLGTLSTSNHRRILGVRLNNGQPDGKPKFLYTSTMHGDEVTGMILMLRLINEFCTSSDSRILNILNNVDLFIFPDTNPDGTYAGGNSTVNGATRKNGNNIDLNRHFPDFDDGAHPDGASYYQDEAQWMMDLAQQYLFTMAANYHGGAEIMNYPWDTYQPLHPDDAWWQHVSSEYANLCHAVSSSYMTTADSSGDTPSGITNGYAWYTITGSRQDYMNYYGQCREVTIECSKNKTPTASTLPNYWNYNHNAMLALIEQCLNGIHGVVKDANTNETIEGATITVKNHDALGSSVTSHAVGDFHRPIKGGTWTLEVSKAGYHTATVSVTVADDQRQDIEVLLTPYGAGEMDCYEQTMPSAAGNYVMGYLNGSTLVMPSHNSSSTVTTTSLDVTATDNGFSVTPGATVPEITLTAYGSNGQYYISYNGRYLARSSGTSLTWGTSQSSYGRWYINSNGIYIIRNSTYYYLYYNNGFKLSTTQQNNLHFYVAGDCPTTSFNITATANPTEGGTVTGAGTFDQGATCTLTATANEGYSFVNWTENGSVVSTSNNYSFQVSGARTLVANFSLNCYSITATANPTEGGTIIGTGTYNHGGTCTLTATANEGYTFVNWTENGEVVSTEAIHSFTVTGDKNLVANFEEPLIPNPAWVPNSNYPGEGMAVVAQIKIDGELLDRDTWELGAFCNGECRACVFPLTDMTADDLGYFAYLNIAGNDDDEISFRLYDAVSGTVIEAVCYTTVELVNSGTLGMDVDAKSLLVLNFVTAYTSTLELSEGCNWVSFCVDITLDDLKAAIQAALPGTSATATIMSKLSSVKYSRGRWVGQLTALDNTQMYMITVSEPCEIVLEGIPVDPTELVVTIAPGANWIAYPFTTESTPTDLFSGFAINDDQVRAKIQSAKYTRGRWAGQLGTLEPGQGYIYISADTVDRIFTYPSLSKGGNKGVQSLGKQ